MRAPANPAEANSSPAPSRMRSRLPSFLRRPPRARTIAIEEIACKHQICGAARRRRSRRCRDAAATGAGGSRRRSPARAREPRISLATHLFELGVRGEEAVDHRVVLGAARRCRWRRSSRPPTARPAARSARGSAAGSAAARPDRPLQAPARLGIAAQHAQPRARRVAQHAIECPASDASREQLGGELAPARWSARRGARACAAPRAFARSTSNATSRPLLRMSAPSASVLPPAPAQASTTCPAAAARPARRPVCEPRPAARSGRR